VKTALITDIHANREALEAVLAHAHGNGATALAFLGDFVGYGADPAWVVDTVRDFVATGALAIQGNHDLATVLGPSPEMRHDAKAVIDWTRSKLSAEQLAFLDELPLSLRYGEKLFVHANAYAPAAWDYVLNSEFALRSMLATPCRYTFCGHMHQPRLFHAGSASRAGEALPKPGAPIALKQDRQWLIIPGSAGQPRDGNPDACYALFDDEVPSIIYFRVPYDHEAAAGKVRSAGLPLRLASRLLSGH